MELERAFSFCFFPFHFRFCCWVSGGDGGGGALARLFCFLMSVLCPFVCPIIGITYYVDRVWFFIVTQIL